MKRTKSEIISSTTSEESAAAAIAIAAATEKPISAAPRKRAVKKTASKPEMSDASAPAAPAAAEAPSAPIAAAPAAASAIVIGEAAPAKPAAKKAAAKKTVRSAAAAAVEPVPLPEPPVLVLQSEEPPAAKPKVAKKAAAVKKKTAKKAEGDVDFPAEPVAAEPIPAPAPRRIEAEITSAPAAPAAAEASAAAPEPAAPAVKRAGRAAVSKGKEPKAAAAAEPVVEVSAAAASSSAPGDTRTGEDFTSDTIAASPSTDGEVSAGSRDAAAPSHRPRHPRNGSYPAPRPINPPSSSEGSSSAENREAYSGPARPDYGDERPNNGTRPPRPERDRDRDRDYDDRAPGSGPGQGQGQGGPGMATGPDGDPRRLTKFERWKLRKEKFKQQKQQRYLERTGRAPQSPGAPGPNGRGPGEGPPGQGQGPGFNQDSRAPRDPRDQQRDPRESRDPRDQQRDPRESRDPRENRDPRDPRESRDPRNGNGGEPRVWEPRPPRPEPVLGPPEDCEGLLEMQENKGFGFLRPRDRNFGASPQDPFVSAELVRQLGLRDGVYIEAVMRRGGRGPMVQEIKKVNGLEPNAYRLLPLFEELTAVNPNKRYILETESNRNTTRLIDFISPIGRGQRGLIVAPPRAGKTTFLQHIAEAMLQKYPEVKVIVLLVDERPEEVTELSRALPGAEIMASSNDQDPRNHIRMAHLAIERAKRLVEAGQHVFMLLDSITRLARGFNNAIRGGGGGKAMSGGLDSRALEAPRRLFAAARNTREAGSLTIMATALVETNNKGDDLIFQEFKGTGNMELVLDRKISQQYVYPAVDIFKSGTRREELLLPAHQLEKVHLIRRGLSGHRPVEAVERLLQVMGKYPNNNQMLIDIKSRE